MFRGATFAYELRAPDRTAPLFVYPHERATAAAGDTVGLRWEPGSAVVLQEPT